MRRPTSTGTNLPAVVADAGEGEAFCTDGVFSGAGDASAAVVSARKVGGAAISSGAESIVPVRNRIMMQLGTNRDNFIVLLNLRGTIAVVWRSIKRLLPPDAI
jgi:hypothetical protein